MQQLKTNRGSVHVFALSIVAVIVLGVAGYSAYLSHQSTSATSDEKILNDASNSADLQAADNTPLNDDIPDDSGQ